MKEALLRIHIDDISNIKSIDLDSMLAYHLMYPSMHTSQMALYKALMENMKAEIEGDSMKMVIPTSLLYVSDDMMSIISMSKLIIERANADYFRPHGDEDAIDMYYNMSSYRFYWDTCHTNKVVMLNMRAEPSSVGDAIQWRIAQSFGNSVIFHDDCMMFIDPHGEYEAAMGRITRICDTLSYEMSSNPDIYNDKYRYTSGRCEHYISIIKMNP